MWSLLSVLPGLYLTFDLGVGSALTKFVAEYRAAGDQAALRSVVTMGTAIYMGLSLLILASLALLRGPILDLVRVAPALRGEAQRESPSAPRRAQVHRTAFRMRAPGHIIPSPMHLS